MPERAGLRCGPWGSRCGERTRLSSARSRAQTMPGSVPSLALLRHAALRDGPAAAAVRAPRLHAVPVDRARRPVGRKIEPHRGDSARDQEQLMAIHQELRPDPRGDVLLALRQPDAALYA